MVNRIPRWDKVKPRVKPANNPLHRAQRRDPRRGESAGRAVSVPSAIFFRLG